MSFALPASISMSVMPSRLLRRNPAEGYDGWDEKARRAYDDQTLFYDVFAAGAPEKPGTVYAVGPVLRPNIRQFLKAATVELDGVAAEVAEISQSKWACILRVWAPVGQPSTLTIRHPTASFRCAVSPSDLSRYAGLRTVFTLSRNNELQWVRDWARYHVEAHGAEAVLLFDNLSVKYACDSLCQTLAEVPDLKAFDVVPMPFEYGPTGNTADRINARFLQFGVFEMARLRFLGRVAGVLNVDIDELVFGPKGKTVFEAMAQTESGFLTLQGEWRYCAPGRATTHGNHYMRSKADEDQINPKWCLNPNGPLRGKSWRTHGIKKVGNSERVGFGFF